LRIVAPDEEKSAAGLFFDRRLGSKNKPRANFDEVWRGETHFNNTFSNRKSHVIIVVSPLPATASCHEGPGNDNDTFLSRHFSILAGP
jgi:hypothetical protein